MSDCKNTFNFLKIRINLSIIKKKNQFKKLFYQLLKRNCLKNF